MNRVICRGIFIYRMTSANDETEPPPPSALNYFKTTSRGQIPPSPLAIILDHPPTDRGQTRRRNRVACASSIDIIYQRLPKSFKNSNADASLKIICVYSEWCSTYMFWACIRTYVVAREAWSTVISPKKKVYGNFGYWVRKFSNRELKRLRSKVKIIGCSPVRGLETGKLQHTYAINRSLDLSLWTHEAAT